MQPQFITLSGYAKNITGQRFGRLVALGPIGRSSDRKIIWLCRCDCGNTCTPTGKSLRSGNTKSCGCLRDESARARFTKHGYTMHPLYGTWRKMISRCHALGEDSFSNYGARGIEVCAEWRDSFESFCDYVSQLSHYSTDGYTLDRIDNDGNYEPGNVQWATHMEQLRNTRRNRFYTWNGITKCLTDWANEYGISRRALVQRLDRGLDFYDALTTPAHRGRPD